MSNQRLSQEVNPSLVPEVGGWGGRRQEDVAAARTGSSTATPSPQGTGSDLDSSFNPKTPDPVHKVFPEEQEPVPLVEDPPTATLAESQEQEGVFSLSAPVYEPDGMGAVVLRNDWIVETLDGGTRLSYVNERNVALLRVATGLPLPKAGEALV